MRSPEFEASLHDAKLYPQLWRLALGIIVAGGAWVLVSLAIVVGGGLLIRELAPQAAFEFGMAMRNIQVALEGYGSIDNPLAVMVLLTTFLGAFIGPILAARLVHFRGAGSLFGPRADWVRNFGLAIAVTLPILGAFAVLGIVLEPAQPNLAFDRWLLFLLPGLPLLFLQIGSEELIFRGYLQQQLAARFQARWIWMWLPSIVFAMLHFSPATGDNWPLVLLAALTFGLIAADLTERTGDLGAAMGFHFANNFLGIFISSMPGSITALALFVSNTPMSEAGAQSLGMALGILVHLAIWGILVRLIER